MDRYCQMVSIRPKRAPVHVVPFLLVLPDSYQRLPFAKQQQ